MAILECCVGNYNEAIRAEKLGADRVEVCDNLLEGGTTPSYGMLIKLKNDLTIPMMVIIRPRGGNFIFSKDEIEIMKEDIILCKDLGIYGVVIGVLKADNTIDLEVTKSLVELAKPMSITFHMAFDEIEDKDLALEQLIGLGVDRILTKGGKEDAISGIDEIKRLVEKANNRIIIMPGKGVNAKNKDYILEYTKSKEIHGSKIV